MKWKPMSEWMTVNPHGCAAVMVHLEDGNVDQLYFDGVYPIVFSSGHAPAYTYNIDDGFSMWLEIDGDNIAVTHYLELETPDPSNTYKPPEQPTGDTPF